MHSLTRKSLIQNIKGQRALKEDQRPKPELELRVDQSNQVQTKICQIRRQDYKVKIIAKKTVILTKDTSQSGVGPGGSY